MLKIRYSLCNALQNKIHLDYHSPFIKYSFLETNSNVLTKSYSIGPNFTNMQFIDKIKGMF